ncbi:ECF transporter S component [Sporolactobacillus sp. THM7-7]|nr:ECF transporter S component [Sporolactobacillus sp. THM7-7]
MGKGLTTRRMVVAGVLGAISILLGITRLGYIPVPTPAGNATIMHVPAVIGGIIEGPVVGLIIGLIFGVSSFLNASIPLFKDPLVSIVPRLFIGVVAFLVYIGLKRFNKYVAIGAAGFFGSLTNTVFVLAVAVARGYFTLPVALGVAIANGLPEAIVSVIVTLAVVAPWKKIGASRKKKSKIS